jgi:hypothetical protein
MADCRHRDWHIFRNFVGSSVKRRTILSRCDHSGGIKDMAIADVGGFGISPAVWQRSSLVSRLPELAAGFGCYFVGPGMWSSLPS